MIFLNSQGSYHRYVYAQLTLNRLEMTCAHAAARQNPADAQIDFRKHGRALVNEKTAA
ncbi:MAG: hypothetical protein HYR56_02165 [Acidobacteria bacterium]|nr:hypothetical protein [Acidobacteriota bacterium]MBI3421922.1 hypothetical protein [Acidobacteriota bacterium]